MWQLEAGLPALDSTFPLPLDRPFTKTDAVAAGLTKRALASLVDLGLVRRLLRGVYAAAQAPDGLLLRARALSLVVPDSAVVTDWTACWLHAGVLPPGGHLQVPPVSIFRFPGEARLRNELCDSGERTFKPEDLTVLDGMAVTTPLRTAHDLGRLASRDWAMAGLDALLRLGDFTKEELLSDVERWRRQRGVVQLRDLAPRADPRAESPGESVLRLRWTDLSSLPPPVPQVPVADETGRILYWVDLGVEELRFGAEYDGEEHHSSDEDRDHDRERRGDLYDRFGWMIEPVTKVNVFGVTRDVERILHDGIRDARRRLGQTRWV